MLNEKNMSTKLDAAFIVSFSCLLRWRIKRKRERCREGAKASPIQPDAAPGPRGASGCGVLAKRHAGHMRRGRVCRFGVKTPEGPARCWPHGGGWEGASSLGVLSGSCAFLFFSHRLSRSISCTHATLKRSYKQLGLRQPNQ